jgi:L-lactate dehydrogenase complex protein LldG
MNSRTQILAAVASNQPVGRPLPVLPQPAPMPTLTAAFAERLTSIGGTLLQAETAKAMTELLRVRFGSSGRLVHSIPGLTIGEYLLPSPDTMDGRQLENVNVAILNGSFGVTENGAVWLSDQAMPHRALPFICQHLVLTLPPDALVGTLHEAYRRIATDFDYGVFIAGPSKTADIEQSLVIGAHGARSLTVIIGSFSSFSQPQIA